MSSLPGGVTGAPTLATKVYKAMERFMPWKYTGIFSTPEFKSHVPVVSAATRISPASPPFSASPTCAFDVAAVQAERAHRMLSCLHLLSIRIMLDGAVQSR